MPKATSVRVTVLMYCFCVVCSSVVDILSSIEEGVQAPTRRESLEKGVRFSVSGDRDILIAIVYVVVCSSGV